MEPPGELSRYLTMVSVVHLPPWSEGPRGGPEDTVEAIAAAGYQGIQAYSPDQIPVAQAAGLATSGIGRVDLADDLATFVDRWEQAGASSVTLHLGTGFEDDDDATALLEAYLDVRTATSVEVLVETHRATITQDPGRTLRFVETYPELRFTGDLSHWYTGSEMPYGGFDWKLEAIRPVLERTHTLHGRIADSSCAQVAMADDDASPHVTHFCEMWRAVFDGFLDDPSRRELVFAPELLPPALGYARTVPSSQGRNGRDEEVDRWQQALALCDLAERLLTETREAREAGDQDGRDSREAPDPAVDDPPGRQPSKGRPATP